jgi:mono/diheme cytochrome c family protein
MRPLVEGVVSQEGFRPDPVAASGLLADGSGYVMTIPKSVEADFGGTAAMLERGRQRFNIFCVPCHGASGDGKGTVARVPAGFPPLPSYAEPRIRQMPDGQMFATISNGARLMPPYGSQIRVNDRWAIVSYVRALEEVQLASQGSPK